jgi:hypothetical protein
LISHRQGGDSSGQIDSQEDQFRQQKAELAKALRQIKQQQTLLLVRTSEIRRLGAEVNESRETLRKVKAEIAASQLTVVVGK